MNTSSSRILAAVGLCAIAVIVSVGLSRPSHSAGGAVAVQVTNSPLPVTDAGSPAQQQYQTSASFTPQKSSEEFLQQITVPAGKRLVIQGVSLTIYNIASTDHPQVAIHTSVGGTQNDQIVALPTLLDAANGRADYVLPQQAVTFYADSNSYVTISVAGLSASDFTSSSVYGGITGYLVNVP